MSAPTITDADSLTKYVGISFSNPTVPSRVRGISGMECEISGAGANTRATTCIFSGRQLKLSTLLGNRSYSLIAEQTALGLSWATRIYYNLPFISTDIWYNQTGGNISQLYDYNKDAMITEFGGRASNIINITSYDNRWFNASFADSVRFNDTLIVGRTTASNIFKSDPGRNSTAFNSTRTIYSGNFSIKSGNNSNIANCMLYKSGAGSSMWVCDGAII